MASTKKQRTYVAFSDAAATVAAADAILSKMHSPVDVTLRKRFRTHDASRYECIPATAVVQGKTQLRKDLVEPAVDKIVSVSAVYLASECVVDGLAGKFEHVHEQLQQLLTPDVVNDLGVGSPDVQIREVFLCLKADAETDEEQRLSRKGLLGEFTLTVDIDVLVLRSVGAAAAAVCTIPCALDVWNVEMLSPDRAFGITYAWGVNRGLPETCVLFDTQNGTILWEAERGKDWDAMGRASFVALDRNRILRFSATSPGAPVTVMNVSTPRLRVEAVLWPAGTVFKAMFAFPNGWIVGLSHRGVLTSRWFPALSDTKVVPTDCEIVTHTFCHREHEWNAASAFMTPDGEPRIQFRSYTANAHVTINPLCGAKTEVDAVRAIHVLRNIPMDVTLSTSPLSTAGFIGTTDNESYVKLGVLDPATGDATKALSIPMALGTSSPAGSRICSFNDRRLHVWDLSFM